MKKLIINTILLILSLISISCNDDDNGTNSIQNEFVIQGTNFETSNGYLVLDDGPSFTNAFMFVFLEGTMREDNVNGSSLSTNTTHGIALHVELGNTNVSSEQLITDNITDNASFNISDEASALTDIINYDNTYNFGGVQYGEPNESAASYYETNSTGGGTLTINTVTIDLVARTGTVDCTYTMIDENNISISGRFNGTFEILNEF